jgi:biotin transport system substrate-specific component
VKQETLSADVPTPEPLEEKRGIPLAEIAQCGVLIALLAACAQVTVAIGPVPFTLQTLAVCLCALVFAPRQAVLAIAGYLVLGALGLPVFSGGRGGLGVLAGVTGGYLYSYLVAVALGALVRRAVCAPNKRAGNLVRSLAADVVCVLVVTAIVYTLGSLHYLVVSGLWGTDGAWAYVLGTCVLPFLVPDALKAVAAILVARAVRRALPGVAAR